MSVQHAISDFVMACERFGLALNEERRFEARLTEDNGGSDVKRLLDMKRQRCDIRNQIEALAQAAIASLTAQHMHDAALSVSRVVVASWNHLGRWNDVWFDCKCHLTKSAIVAGRKQPIENEWVKRRNELGETVEDQMMVLYKKDSRTAAMYSPEIARILDCSEQSVRKSDNKVWQMFKAEKQTAKEKLRRRDTSDSFDDIDEE